MDRQTIINELRNIIEELLKNLNLDLVDIIYRYEGRDLVLRILIDRPEGGISLGECANLNQEVSRILDEKDILQERYILEVSSPGLDRPLNSRADYLRCINKQVRVNLLESINGKWEPEGVISSVTDESVYIDIRDETFEIPLTKITKGKRVINEA